MTLRSLTIPVRRFLDVRPGEIRHVAFMAALLFFLLAANNVIKVVRDSLFLSRFPITQLPYVYLLAALAAGVIIALYSKYTAKLSLPRVVLASLAFVIINVVVFWLLITFSNAAWVLYAYYMWSAIVGLILVAQFWTLTGGLFTPRDGKRLFGIISAGGTLGGMIGGMASNWAVRFLFSTSQLLWLVAVFLVGAFAVAYLALRERDRFAVANYRDDGTTKLGETRDSSGMMRTMMSSPYLQTIAAMIFVSVVVSTLIDYQFKATAKLSYASADNLAGFFGSYYGWLSLVTMLAQLWLTGKLLTGLGLRPSLLVLPASLLAGSFALLAWPGLVAATATRLTEAALRTSVNQSSVQILYLPIADAIKKKVKVFMDVTVERLGDGVAALIILSYSLLLGGLEITLLSYVAIALLTGWFILVFRVNAGYVDALRRSLTYREVSLETASIDFADKKTRDAVLATLDRQDERSILFALDLMEKAEPRIAAARLPRGLLRHASAEVRRRVLRLLAASPESDAVAALFEVLTSESAQARSEAIQTLAAVPKIGAAPFVRPLMQSPHAQTRRAAIQLLLGSGDEAARREAFEAFRVMVAARGSDGEEKRVEAARFMGESVEPEFSGYLSQLIRTDESAAVVREALASAARGQYAGVVDEAVAQLGNHATRTEARQALAQYGPMAVKALRNALFDDRTARDIRLNIPGMLSKIHAQSAMNALLGGLLEDDRALRFKVILAIEEMSRRFTDLRADREIVESAIMSDALLYCRRFVAFTALFGQQEKLPDRDQSLLYFALTDSMDRVKERVMWLLSLIHPARDIRRAWSGLSSEDPIQRAHAIEFLDNLIIGTIKQYAFILYSDSPEDQRVRTALDLLGIDPMDRESALRALLEQDDQWLKAATIWEIGRGKLGRFREDVMKFVNSENALLSETARVVIERIELS